MIVLDEQLLGRGLEQTLAAWYRGSVLFITDLRPGTVIKDEAIPTLRHQQRQPTFITINERDFWQKVAINNSFCVVCCAFPDSQAQTIAPLIRGLFRYPEFSTKARRMGKVVRLSKGTAAYYTWNEPFPRNLN